MIKNTRQIADAFGIKASIEPMTFLEANEGRSNINYPRGGVYYENCQSCVVVHEARLRGLNLTALGYNRNNDSVSYKLGEHFEYAWINPRTGKVPQATILRGKDDEDLFSKVEKQTIAIGRYHIGINFYNGRGHIITAERFKSGEIIYYDAQNGDFVNLRELVEVDYFDILKVDKLLLNKDVLVGISELI